MEGIMRDAMKIQRKEADRLNKSMHKLLPYLTQAERNKISDQLLLCIERTMNPLYQNADLLEECLKNSYIKMNDLILYEAQKRGLVI
jgi:hypothetical protein